MSEATRRKINPVKIVLWCLLGAIGLFVLVVLGTLLVEKYIKKAPVPMFMGTGTMVVATGSMSGTIEKGDLIIVKKADEFKLGDIVTFVESNGTIVTHRLVNFGEEEGTFITKGDANNSTDIFPITADQIAGKVVGTVPKVGVIFDWIIHQGGIIYIISLIVIVGAGIFFWHTIGGSESEKAEEGASANAETPESVSPVEKTEDATEETPPQDGKSSNDK